MDPYCAEKNSHRHFRMLFAPRQGGTSINESQKEDTGKKIQDVLFSENRFCSLSVRDILPLTPWVFWYEIFTRHSSLCLLSFGWCLSPRFVPQDWQEIFYSSVPGLKGKNVCVWNCLIFLWVNTHTFDLKFVAFCPRFSRDSWVEFQDKTIPGEFFSNFVQTKSILYRNLWNYGLIYAISFRVLLCWKKLTQALSYVICTQARRHVHKRVRKGRYEDEKPERFVFGKSVFSLSVCDLLYLTPLVFWYEIFTRHSSLCLLSFGWGLSPKFVPQEWQ